MHESNHAIAKSRLRTELRAARSSFQQNKLVIAGFEVKLSELAQRIDAKVIAGYLPFGNEPNIERWLSEQVLLGLTVLMPISQRDKSLRWVAWDGESRAKGIFEFEEAQGTEADFRSVDLVVLPALAATHSGDRLGNGLGYYDRALAGFKGESAAVVFDHELLDSIPTEEHDQKVNFVVTQTRLIKAS